jgi:3-oxoacyl-[acyl-carrier-protein] synthase II
MEKRVVITGLGPVTPIGSGSDALFRNLMEQKTCVCPIPSDFESLYRYHSRWYVPLPLVSLSDYDIPLHFDNIMQHEDRMALAGARIAFEDAGIKLDSNGKYFASPMLRDCCTVIGVGLGGLETAFQSYTAHLGKQNNAGTGLAALRFKRMVIPMTMPNSVAAWLSIFFGLTGGSFTVNASCASGTCAVGEAYMRIKHGYCNIALAGGVESLKESTGAVMRGFDTLGVLTRSADGNPAPFSKQRTGFLFAEGGCCILILEELEHAVKRKARIYAEIAGYALNSDAHNIVQIDSTGGRIISLLKSLAANHKIDYINAHGTGTVENDAVEAGAIQTVFGDMNSQPVIGATKGLLGHTLGASGAIEAGFTALAIAKSGVHGATVSDPVDNLNLAVSSREMDVECAISCSFGFGGHNAGLVLKKVTMHG